MAWNFNGMILDEQGRTVANCIGLENSSYTDPSMLAKIGSRGKSLNAICLLKCSFA
jgi:hypothetical protein